MAQHSYDLNSVGNDRLNTPNDPRAMMASQIFATTPNGTAVLSPNTPMEDVNDVSLLSFLEDPQWNAMQAQVASAASRTDNEPSSTTGNRSSSDNSAATFVEDMDVISPKEQCSKDFAVPAAMPQIKTEKPKTEKPPAPLPVASSGRTLRTPRHRRSASAPAHLLNSVLGKRKPIKSPPPAQRASSKSRAAKLSRARASGGEAEGRRASFEDPIEEEACGGRTMSFALKQGKEGSRDQGKVNKHPTWIRSNMRATWGHLSIACESPEESEALEALLRDGKPYGDYAAASIVFEMLYDNGDEVELLEKKGGNLADRVKLILPNGNVEQGITMQNTSIGYHTEMGGSKQWVKSNYFQFDSTRFPWNSDKRARAMDAEDTVVEIGLKFATNVTTRAHNKRNFMWRVDLRMYDLNGSELAHHQTISPPFAYLPRNPEKSTQDFRLDDVVCDGHPGELLMCGGSGLGCKERPQLVALLRGPKGAEFTLSRQSVTKSTFVSRLPAEAPPGAYTVQLVNEENPDEVSEEVKTVVLQGNLGACFELDEFTKQLEAEALSRHGSSEDDESEM